MPLRPRQLDRLLLSELARLFAATLAGVVVLYLVIDFADRGSSWKGDGWVRAVALLYANKAAVVAHQLAPAALVLAATLLVAQLGRRGELTALHALGIPPWRLAVPVLAFAVLLGGAMWVVGEAVVVRADARAEEITVRRFLRWGDWGAYHADSSWLKGREGRVFHLGAQRDGGFEPATMLELDARYRLLRRLDARRMEPAGAGRWRFLDAVETRYPEGGDPGAPRVAERRDAVREEAIPDSAQELSLRSGRPRQLPFGALREQAERRERLGQPSREYRLALAERVAGVVQVAPAALAALGLVLWRRRRQGPRPRPLPGAVALGLSLALGLWALAVVAHAAAMGGAIATWVAAFAPAVLCSAGGALLVARAR